MTSHEARRGGVKPWLWVALAAVVMGLLFFAYRSYQERQQREAALGAMVSAFQELNSLSVFKAQVPVFVTNRKDGWIFDSEQFGVIPASVEYRLDLSKLDKNQFDWNSDTRRMIVTIPTPRVSEPNLDMTRAKLVNRGVLVTGETALELLRKNTVMARREALEEANNPQMMQLAREAARKAMVHNVTVPLRAAGYEDTEVAVRFADEAEEEPSYLDVSTSYNEAIEDARRRRASQGQR